MDKVRTAIVGAAGEPSPPPAGGGAAEQGARAGRPMFNPSSPWSAGAIFAGGLLVRPCLSLPAQLAAKAACLQLGHASGRMFARSRSLSECGIRAWRLSEEAWSVR